MNKEQLLGQWNQLKGKIKEKWGKLSDDDIAQINGRREQLLGKLQQRYGYAKDKAEQELKRWENNFREEDSFNENEDEEIETPRKKVTPRK